MTTLSVVLAARNEASNIDLCLKSVKGISDEIVVVDEYSSDATPEIARSHGAKVFKEKHHDIFHITKQKALSLATGDWILQLDADEVVTPKLAQEITRVINLTNRELLELRAERLKNKLFKRHQELIEVREGKLGLKNGEIVAFFIPRLNFFLGKSLKHAGVYPDGVIRLVKNGKAMFPQRSVHEQIQIDGEVSWLENPLEHHDSPTFSRYIQRMNRYTDLTAEEFKKKKIPKNVLFLTYYSIIVPKIVFLKLYIRHKGILDGMRGFVWSMFSSLHFPIAYFKYWTNK